jgi:hypothetical protein
LSEKRYIDFDQSNINLDRTKFRIVDNTVIFPPKKSIAFDKAYMTFHIEMKSQGNKTRPVKVQRMSLSSLAFDQGIAQLYPVGTKTGNSVYPFTRVGPTYSNKIKNPFLIYKDTSPYLYLTGDSGMQSIPYPEIESEASINFARGISLPVNPKKTEGTEIYGMHIWAMYNKSNVFEETEKCFSFYYDDEKYNFYLVPETGGKRAKLVARKEFFFSEEEAQDVLLYKNGIQQNVYIDAFSWSLITIQFLNPVDLSQKVGQFEIYPGILFNNLTVYEETINKKVDDIFESHLGLSNIVSDDTTTLLINSNELSLFSDIKWTNFSGKPV